MSARLSARGCHVDGREGACSGVLCNGLLTSPLRVEVGYEYSRAWMTFKVEWLLLSSYAVI